MVSMVKHTENLQKAIVRLIYHAYIIARATCIRQVVVRLVADSIRRYCRVRYGKELCGLVADSIRRYCRVRYGKETAAITEKYKLNQLIIVRFSYD